MLGGRSGYEGSLCAGGGGLVDFGHLSSSSGRFLILLLDLTDEKTLEVSISLIHLLHFYQNRCLHIRQANGDGLHLSASSR